MPGGDIKSERFQKMRNERRELVQYAVEELIKKHGGIPSASEVARELGLGRKPVQEDWDWLYSQGKLPERFHGNLPRRVAGRSLGADAGGRVLAAEALMRQIITEIRDASPEYRSMAQVFWVEHLETISRLTEQAIALAVGTTVDDLIGQIRKEER